MSKEHLMPPWKPGQSGNPKGRPRGSRDEFNEAFIRALKDEWNRRGAQAMSELSAADLARIGVQVLSKESKVGVDVAYSGSVQHVGLSETDSWIRATIGGGEDGASQESLPN